MVITHQSLNNRQPKNKEPNYRKYEPNHQSKSAWTIASITFISGLLIGHFSNITSEKPSQSSGEYIMYTYPGMSSKTSQTIENRIISLIDSAKTEIYLNGYGFTSAQIAQSLINAHKRGVNIYILLDRSNDTDSRTQAPMLSTYIKTASSKSDFQIHIRDLSGIHHAKVITIDEDILIIGSYNWTKGARDRNDEIVLFTINKECVQKAREAWYHWLKIKSHQFGDIIANREQPWKLEHRPGPEQKPVVKNKDSSTAEPAKQNGKWHLFNLGNKKSTKQITDTIRKQLTHMLQYTAIDKIRNSKKRCYMQIPAITQDMLTEIVHAKQRGVEVIIVAQNLDNTAQDILKRNNIKYRIDSAGKFDKLFDIIDSTVFCSKNNKVSMNTVVDNDGYILMHKPNSAKGTNFSQSRGMSWGGVASFSRTKDGLDKNKDINDKQKDINNKQKDINVNDNITIQNTSTDHIKYLIDDAITRMFKW